MGPSFGWDRKTRGPVSLQVWQDKDPSLLKDPEIPEGWGGSSYTFGYRRTAEIFETPPFINSIFLKTVLIHIFPLKSWPNHIFHNIIVTWFYIHVYFYQFKDSISMYMCTFFYPCGPKLANKYSILFYIDAACAKLEDEFQRYIYHPLI
jgi:hypothetical protein